LSRGETLSGKEGGRKSARVIGVGGRSARKLLLMQKTDLLWRTASVRRPGTSPNAGEEKKGASRDHRPKGV